MKHQFLGLLFTATSFLFGQTEDTRALLQFYGGLNEISVSPDEKIWLTSGSGNTFFTNSIDSNWHYGPSLAKENKGNVLYSPNLDRISFFNSDTAIITGYISSKKNDHSKGGFFRTTNGGKSWDLLDYGGDSWIYHVELNKSGHAWMGGSSGKLHYSTDFGKTWSNLSSPYNSSTRVHCIFMTTNKIGISASLDNYIFSTSSNWESTKSIPTPLDQELCDPHFPNRLDKIVIWKDFMVVKQNGKVFYSHKESISWKAFELPIIDFELDRSTGRLFGITKELRVVVLSSPTIYYLLNKPQLDDWPKDLQIVNHSLYLLTRNDKIYKIDSDNFSHIMLYTFDKPIERPHKLMHSENLSWGATYNHLYLSHNKGRDWYRENFFDFYIESIKYIDDSTAILWDGNKHNYIYSLKSHRAKIYHYTSPLNDFISYPLKSLRINSGSSGCYHKYADNITYGSKYDTVLVMTDLMLSKKGKVMRNIPHFEPQVETNLLLGVLKKINSNPSLIPSIKDFNITEAEEKAYLKLVKKCAKDKNVHYSLGTKKMDPKFYKTIPSMVEGINDSTLELILDQKESFSSTTSSWFEIEIINANSDTLNVRTHYSFTPSSWHLPWEFEFKGQHFNCYDPQFSRFISSCLPEGFHDSEAFNNSTLMMAIGNYLYH